MITNHGYSFAKAGSSFGVNLNPLSRWKTKTEGVDGLGLYSFFKRPELIIK